MKQWVVGSSLLLGLVLLLGAAYTAFSQQGPDGMAGGRTQGGGGMRGMPPMHIVKAGAQGLFLLQGTTLLKFSSSLQAQGKLDLGSATTGHPQPATFLLAGNDVVAIVGTTFYRVDGKTMQVAVKATLPDVALPTPPTSTDNGQRQMQPPMAPPPALELYDNTLYVMHGPALLALNIVDGSVLGQTTLPKPTGTMPAPNDAMPAPNDAMPAPPQ